jgi:gliding motility-associated-like protein
MQKHVYALLSIVASVSAGFSQTNLVPNPGFEEYDDCPVCCYTIQTSLTSFPYVSDWFAPTAGTSDYFNTCGDESTSGGIPNTYWWGYNPSHLCDGMVGFFAYEDFSSYREYISTQLFEPLVAGVQYYVEFYATTAFNPCSGGLYDFIIATDEVGAYFSDDAITEWSTYDYLDVEPQIQNEEGIYLEDSATWYKISGIYTAVGGEQYITIGTFVSDEDIDYVYMHDEEPGSCLLSSYIFVDDVVVTEYTGVEPTIPGEVILCEGETVDLSGPFGAVSYTWSTGDTTQTITVGTEGEYSLSVFLACDTMYYNFNVFVSPTEDTSTYTNLELCTTDFPIILTGEPGYIDYEWNTGWYNDSLTVTEGGVYVVTASNICNIHKDTIVIDALDPADVVLDIGNDTLICTNDPWNLVADATGLFNTYNWNTGETTPSINITEPGTYQITAENICGTWFDEIIVQAGTILQKPDLGPDVVLCEEDGITEVTLSAPEQECYYFWNTLETTPSIIVHAPGTYWLECTNICGKVSDTVNVQLCTYIYIPNAFSPNGDGVNDILAPVYYPNVQLISFEIYNRWGELVFQTSDITKGWDGTFNNENQPMETYTYIVVFNEYGYNAIKTGNITLVR